MWGAVGDQRGRAGPRAAPIALFSGWLVDFNWECPLAQGKGFPWVGWSRGAAAGRAQRGEAAAFPLGLKKGLLVALPQGGGLTLSPGKVGGGHSFGGFCPK